MELGIPTGTSQISTCLAQHTAGRDEVRRSKKWPSHHRSDRAQSAENGRAALMTSGGFQSPVSAPPSSPWTSRPTPVLPSISSPCVLFPHLLCFSCSKGGWKQLLLQGFLQSLEPVWHSPPECLMYKSLLFSWTPNSGYFRKRLWIKAVIYHWDKKIWKLVKTCIQTLIPWKWNCSRSGTENSESCRKNEII